jgi:PAS domain-containing protein
LPSPDLNSEVSPDLTSVLDQSIVGTYVIQDGVLVYDNEKLAEWFGYDRGEIIGEKGPLD